MVRERTDQRVTEIKKLNEGGGMEPPSLNFIIFQISYYLCKEYPAMTPLTLNEDEAVEVFELFVDTCKMNDNLKELREIETGEKVIERKARDNSGWW